MFAFLRVIVFYLGFAALLTWGIFALGWADAIELPGFEGAPPPMASVPPRTPVADPAPERPQSRAVSAETLTKPVIVPEPTRVAETDVKPAEERSAEILPSRTTEHAPRRDPPPAQRIEVATPAPPMPRTTETVKAMEPASHPETKKPDVVAVVTPASPRPQVKEPAQARAADVSPVAEPTRPPPQTQPPAAKALAVLPSTTTSTGPVTRSWSPQRRIAGFDADALVDVLEDARRPADDVPCVMFRGLAYKAGTTQSVPRSGEFVGLIAEILNTTPAARVEIGSRLGPGRPMVTDGRLRSDRARDVRERLIELGVAPERLTIDTSEAFERVSEDIARARGGRAQSIGLCIHST